MNLNVHFVHLHVFIVLLYTGLKTISSFFFEKLFRVNSVSESMAGEDNEDYLLYPPPSAPFNPGARANSINANPPQRRRLSTFSEFSDFQCSRLFKSKLGIWSVFGLIYWLSITLIAYFMNKDTYSNISWLFTYSVISCVIALCLQFGVMAMVIAGLNEKNKHFKNTDLPFSVISVFPYTLMIIIDIFVHVGVSFAEEKYIEYSIALIICHLCSLFFITFIYFEWHRGHTFFRFINFAFEWIDILSQIAVALIYSKKSDAANKHIITNVFWSFILIQLLFWTLPILLGSAQKMKKIAWHIVVLDIVTDIPLVITTLLTGAYKVQFWILIDLFIKVLLMARGVIWNICLHIFIPYIIKK